MLPSPTDPSTAVSRTSALFCAFLVTYAFLNPGPTSGIATPKISTRWMASALSVVSNDRRSLDLRAVHDATGARVERVTPVQRATVVPQDEVVALPHLPEREVGLR